MCMAVVVRVTVVMVMIVVMWMIMIVRVIVIVRMAVIIVMTVRMHIAVVMRMPMVMSMVVRSALCRQVLFHLYSLRFVSIPYYSSFLFPLHLRRERFVQEEANDRG